MKCKSCGKEIKDTAVFCEFCGAKVGEETIDKEPSTEVEEIATGSQVLESTDTHEESHAPFENKESDILPETKEEPAKGSLLKKWYMWAIIVLSVLLIVGLIILFGNGGSSKGETSVGNSSIEEEIEDEVSDESEEAVDEEEESTSDVAWTEKEYVVVSLYNKKTKKTTDISSGFGLKVNNMGTLVNVNDDEEGDCWGQVSIPSDEKDDIEVKIEKYGTGDKDVVVYINDSVVANGKNLCVDGMTTLINVHPLMDQSEYEAQRSIDKDDIVKIEVN